MIENQRWGQIGVSRPTPERLIAQVDQIELAAERAEDGGFADDAPIIRRSGFVLAVASIDTYFHEQAARLLRQAALRSLTDAATVANYCRNVSAADVSGPAGESYIRMQLSYKTLVNPRNIDVAFRAANMHCDMTWRSTAFDLGTRPERLRIQLELFYDRRNQIAHEGDWDLVQLEFRTMDRVHLNDCITYLRSLARAMDPHL